MRRLEERRQDSSEEYYDEEEDGGMERALTPGELEGHIPVTKAEGDKVDQVCSICVDEFRPEEEIRTLPACGHSFHATCIGQWLTGSRPTCPNCNSNVREAGPAELRE